MSWVNSVQRQFLANGPIAAAYKLGQFSLHLQAYISLILCLLGLGSAVYPAAVMNELDVKEELPLSRWATKMKVRISQVLYIYKLGSS